MDSFILENLRPLDWIPSYKEPEHWYEELPDAAIIKYGRRCCPDGYHRLNHIRIVLLSGTATDPPIGFEWTAPRSRFIVIEQWMLTPGYSWVMRHKDMPLIKESLILDEANRHNNKIYDYLQLLGMYLNCEWLQFGENHEVCSTGATEITENLTGLNLFPNLERWQVPPCSVVNDTDWSCLNVFPEHDFMIDSMTEFNEPMYPALERRESCEWL